MRCSFFWTKWGIALRTNKADNDAAVSRAISEVETTLAECKNIFDELRGHAQEHTRVLDNSFIDTVEKVISQIKDDYDQGHIAADDAVAYLSRAADIAHRVGRKEAISPELFTMTWPINLDEMKSKLAYKKSREHAIMGLITTMAIVGSVVVLLALAGPSMGASLLFLLPLALSGAGCGIPQALEGRRLHVKAESDDADVINIPDEKFSGYAQKLQEAYKSLLPKNEAAKSDRDDDPEYRDGEEHKDSP